MLTVCASAVFGARTFLKYICRKISKWNLQHMQAFGNKQMFRFISRPKLRKSIWFLFISQSFSDEAPEVEERKNHFVHCSSAASVLCSNRPSELSWERIILVRIFPPWPETITLFCPPSSHHHQCSRCFLSWLGLSTGLVAEISHKNASQRIGPSYYLLLCSVEHWTLKNTSQSSLGLYCLLKLLYPKKYGRVYVPPWWTSRLLCSTITTAPHEEKHIKTWVISWSQKNHKNEKVHRGITITLLTTPSYAKLFLFQISIWLRVRHQTMYTEYGNVEERDARI